MAVNWSVSRDDTKWITYQPKCAKDTSKQVLNKILNIFFAGILPDALRTECRKCSEQQRRGSERVLKYIIENKPAQWGNLQRKYDPGNVYIQQAGRLGIRVPQ